MSKWIQKAVPESHRGLATAAAKRAGESLPEWAHEHAHSANPTIRGRANFALRAEHGGFGKKKRHTLKGALEGKE